MPGMLTSWWFFLQEPEIWGWRLSLGIAGLPALIILVGSFILPESPTWLIEKGAHKEAKDASLPPPCPLILYPFCGTV